MPALPLPQPPFIPQLHPPHPPSGASETWGPTGQVMGHQPLLFRAYNQQIIPPGGFMTALPHLTAQGVFWFLASINPGFLGHSGSPQQNQA